MQTREITLPLSGETWTVKRPGLLEAYRIRRALPDLMGDGAGEAAPLEALEAGIRWVVMCVQKPKLWVDLRPELEALQHPMTCPPGYRELDLDEGDFTYLLEQIGNWRREDKEALDPTAPTGKG